MKFANTVLLALSLFGTLCSCSHPPPQEVETTPLFDDDHRPDILIEKGCLEQPPSTSGNRFLTGWRHDDDDFPLINDGQELRLELVHLDPRPRTLILFGQPDDFPPNAEIDAWVAGRRIGPCRVSDNLEIPLPADLPLGRNTVELRIPADKKLRLQKAQIVPNHSPGDASIDEDVLQQSGWSIVDLVRWVPTGATFSGQFTPAADSRPSQAFACFVQRNGEDPRPIFWWSATEGLQPLDFSAELNDISGLVRFRFAAFGKGPAARWHDLQLSSPSTPDQPPATTPEAPRIVLLYVMDALRADALGHLGGRAQASPVLDRLASAGITFVDHLAAAPSTLPSTRALFTGEAIQHSRKLAEHGSPTLAECFADAGYTTAAFSGNGFVSPDFGTTRGFKFFELLPPTRAATDGGLNTNAEDVHAAALEWLRSRPADDKIFLYLHTLHPHNPYAPPEPFRSRLGHDRGSSADGSNKTLIGLRDGALSVTAADQEQIRDLYLGGLAYNDDRLKGFVEELGTRCPADEILSVFTSDHGEEFFEHGGVLHGYALYETDLHVPLIFHWPGRIEAGAVDRSTTTIDVHNSLRALVDPGIDPGSTLWALMQKDVPNRKDASLRFAAAPAAQGLFMARSDQHKLIWARRSRRSWGMGHGINKSHQPEYFFDLHNDPEEQQNLIGSGSLEEAWLRSRLLAWIETHDRSRTAQKVLEIDQDVRKQLEALGYMEPESGL